MNLYVWAYAENATEHWHAEAGVVVLAGSVERARDLLRGQVRDACDVFKAEPKVIGMDQEWVGVFPDAGCC